MIEEIEEEVIERRTEMPTGGSLAERMKERAAALEANQTHRFPIPGWEELLEVELKSLSYATIRRVIQRLDRVKDVGTHDLYAMADQIATATEGLYEITPDGESRPLDDDWIRLANRLPDAPEGMTTRQAVLFLVGDKRIHFLVQEWGEWAKSVRTEVDEEVARDFG